MTISFVPTPDVAAVLHILLDVYERRGGAPKQAVRVHLDDVAGTLPGYYSQTDPSPRAAANEQLVRLQADGSLGLTWQPGQTGHLLETATLALDRVDRLYALLGRESLADRRYRLRALLLGERFRFAGWRRRAVQDCLDRLKGHKSPTPFDLDDGGWNRDLLDALIALPKDPQEQVPYRVFSVRVFNDSKRFDRLKGAVARLARRYHPEWRPLTNRELLRELGLVANPDHVYLYGPWRLVDGQGQLTSLSEFYPSVGIPTMLASRLARAETEADRVICVENLAPFYELIKWEGRGLAALCLWGNPSPASRHLLGRLAQTLPTDVPLLLWADLDYGGLSILAQLREKVSPRFAPYRMDPETLEAHAHWAQPLTSRDERYLARLNNHPLLVDMLPLIEAMLERGVKLEQEAVALCSNSPEML